MNAATFGKWLDRALKASMEIRRRPELGVVIGEKVEAFFAKYPGVRRDEESEAVLTVIFFEAQPTTPKEQ